MNQFFRIPLPQSSFEKGTFFENVYNRLNVEKMITDEMLLVFAEIQKTVAFLASIKYERVYWNELYSKQSKC